ncbi:MAG TPA: hypothetical protein VGT07_07645 [Steroidobacteraceae bacterium]|nr:hypothetical protein [Steroidobacteraceae bacterium]
MAKLADLASLTSLFNGRSPAFSAARRVVFGCVGRLLGVTLP